MGRISWFIQSLHQRTPWPQVSIIDQLNSSEIGLMWLSSLYSPSKMKTRTRFYGKAPIKMCSGCSLGRIGKVGTYLIWELHSGKVFASVCVTCNFITLWDIGNISQFSLQVLDQFWARGQCHIVKYVANSTRHSFPQSNWTNLNSTTNFHKTSTSTITEKKGGREEGRSQ